jgi:DNA-binding PadR family transcriptional regulator
MSGVDMSDRRRAELLQGTLDLLILKALAAQELHGLGVSRRIHQITHGTFDVGPGSLFPALHRLEEAGWLTPPSWRWSEHNRRAKFYRLTKAGQSTGNREKSPSVYGHRLIPPRIHLAGGRKWWAHFDFTRINIERIILRKRSRNCASLALYWREGRQRLALTHPEPDHWNGSLLWQARHKRLRPAQHLVGLSQSTPHFGLGLRRSTT